MSLVVDQPIMGQLKKRASMSASGGNKGSGSWAMLGLAAILGYTTSMVRMHIICGLHDQQQRQMMNAVSVMPTLESQSVEKESLPAPVVGKESSFDYTKYYTDEEEAAISLNKPACGAVNTNQTKLSCAPRFIIAGVMKCGTNEAGQLIAKHPRMKFNTFIAGQKGTDDTRLYQGAIYEGRLNLHESQPWLLKEESEWGRFFTTFPDTDGVNTVTIDKSPAYLDMWEGPELVKKLMPDTKIVFTLCDPAERLVSEFFHYRHEVNPWLDMEFKNRNVDPPMDLGQLVTVLHNQTAPSCSGNLANCTDLAVFFKRRGSYAELFERWFEFFDREDLLFLDMNAPNELNAKKLVQFAGLSLKEYPWQALAEKGKSYANENYGGRKKAWKTDSDALHQFTKLFKGRNEALAEKIGLDFPLGWPSTEISKGEITYEQFVERKQK